MRLLLGASVAEGSHRISSAKAGKGQPAELPLRASPRRQVPRRRRPRVLPTPVGRCASTARSWLSSLSLSL